QLLSAAIRALGLGLVTLVGLPLFRIRSASARHATWTVVLAGMLVQIPVGMVAPTVPLKALHIQPARIIAEPARVSVPAARSPAPASHTRTAPERRWAPSGGTLT